MASIPPYDLAGRRRRRIRWGLAVLAFLAAFGVVAAELFARWALGLGDPPLFLPDAKIEYLNKPGIYHRFGNTISINSRSMRSPEFPDHKTDATELRVLFLGDSIIHGGTFLDDQALATRTVAALLKEVTGRRTVTGNASAGSWGPPNLAAYVDRFGWVGADVVIVVLSSDDATDIPTFAPLSTDQPTSKPHFALQEALGRYLPRYLPGRSAPPPPPPAELDAAALAQCAAALEHLVTKARAAGVRIGFVFHWRLSEVNTGPRAGLAALGQIADRLGVPVFTDELRLRAELDAGARVYFDDIHLSALGQRMLADVLLEAVNGTLNAPLGGTRAEPDRPITPTLSPPAPTISTP